MRAARRSRFLSAALLRRFATPRRYVDDVSLSRIYLGVHYRFSGELGIAMGTAIGDLGARRYFPPLARREG